MERRNELVRVVFMNGIAALSGMRGVSAAVACLAAVPAVTGYMMGGFAGRQLAMPRRETARQGGMTMRLFDHKQRAIKEREQLEGWAKPGEEAHVEPSETNLRPFPGNYKKHYRSGRGPGAGSPGSSGYGMRGQNSRGGVRPGFEGGQQPQYRRAPKWPGRPMGPGHERTEYALIQLEDLNVAAELFPNRNVVDPKFLVNYYVLTKQKRKLFKVVGGDATLDRGLTVMAHAFTSSAAAAIEQAGGKCVLLSPTTNEVLPIEGVDVEAVMSQVKTEEAKTAEEEAAGVYFDHPRPGGARDRVRKALREADREAFERLSAAA